MQHLRGAYALDAFAQTVATGNILDFQPWKNTYHAECPTVEWEEAILSSLKDCAKWVDKNLLLQY